MNKLLALLLIGGILGGCNDNGEVKAKIDSVGKKFDSSAQRLYDTAKEKGRELKDKIKEKLDNNDASK
ncbi:MAG TPA: hypothetical protein VFQ58_00905 [Flavisolibacter sp.]|jgi:hypothetical protein|nr:hypothetical protein [Flavisolibacter sp.]